MAVCPAYRVTPFLFPGRSRAPVCDGWVCLGLMPFPSSPGPAGLRSQNSKKLLVKWSLPGKAQTEKAQPSTVGSHLAWDTACSQQRLSSACEPHATCCPCCMCVFVSLCVDACVHALVCGLHRLGNGPGMISEAQQVGGGGGQLPPLDHPLLLPQRARLNRCAQRFKFSKNEEARVWCSSFTQLPGPRLRGAFPGTKRTLCSQFGCSSL